MSNFYNKKKNVKKFLKNHETLRDLKEVWIFILPHPRILKRPAKKEENVFKKHFLKKVSKVL
jgi:uracil-DNA glycosylase